MAEIVAVCVSERKGEQKVDVGEGVLKEDHGLVGDAHAGDWHRQVSLLAVESINKMRDKGLDVGPGDFAENLTVSGMELHTLPVGTRIQIGGYGPILEVTQIGKECHTRCAIFYQAGECVMPTEGIFAIVLREGRIKRGDRLSLVEQGRRSTS